MRLLSTHALSLVVAGLFALAACDDSGGGNVGPTPDVTDTDTTTGDVPESDDGTPDATDPDTTVGPDTPVDPDTSTNDCPATWECGTSATGKNCGTCQAGTQCNAAHKCEAPGLPNGSFCGANAECTPDDDDYPNCLHDQCASKFCLNAGIQGAWITYPVCTTPCEIYKDTVNNKTGANGKDGVEDPDSPLTDCGDFADGPGGTDYVCASFSQPDAQNVSAFCVPTQFFGNCKADTDCPEGEGCFLAVVGTAITEKCLTKVKPGEWGGTASLGEICNEDPFGTSDVAFCESGLCFGLGCVSYCKSDADCDTTAGDPTDGCDTGSGTCRKAPNVACTTDLDCSGMYCDEPRTIFSNSPYEAQFCWPKSCETDANCIGDAYCRFNWNGEEPPDHAWQHICLPQVEGGAALGEPCDANPDDNIPGDTCANEDMCIGGFCSAICKTDADCATDKGQLCTVFEFTLDVDDDETPDASLPLNWCTTYPGATTDCLSEVSCGEGYTCEVYEVENLVEGAQVADGPYTLRGKCVPAEAGAGEYGASCMSGADCKAGLCLGADSATNTPGFCSQTCEAATECPSLDLTDEGGQPVTLTSRCTSLLYAWGGDFEDPTINVYLSLCQPNPQGSSAEDCSDDFTCDEGQSCQPYVVAFGPDYPSKTDYLCIDILADDAPTPTKQLGEACDLDAEDFECVSGLCLEGAGGQGYCSALCDPDNDTCATEGSPNMVCDDLVLRPRKGIYAENTGAVPVCTQVAECTPCGFGAYCPGDLACVNLGLNSTDLAAFNCVEPCETNDDCDAPFECQESVNAWGETTKGCFEKNATTTLPKNHCL